MDRGTDLVGKIMENSSEEVTAELGFKGQVEHDWEKKGERTIARRGGQV